MAFVLCNMDKINMSVAIIPMAQDFGWSSSIAGAVQASFFWGYLLFQLPGGYLASAKGVSVQSVTYQCFECLCQTRTVCAECQTYHSSMLI